MKCKIYDDKNMVRGEISISDNQSIIGFRANRSGEVMKKFKELVRKFLEAEGLKMASNEASGRKHHKYNEYSKSLRGFRVYYKYRNPRTRKLELKEIKNEKTCD